MRGDFSRTDLQAAEPLQRRAATAGARAARRRVQRARRHRGAPRRVADARRHRAERRSVGGWRLPDRRRLEPARRRRTPAPSSGRSARTGRVLKAAPGTQPWVAPAGPGRSGHPERDPSRRRRAGLARRRRRKGVRARSGPAGRLAAARLPAGTTGDLYDVLVVGSNVGSWAPAGTILRWDGAQWVDHQRRRGQRRPARDRLRRNDGLDRRRRRHAAHARARRRAPWQRTPRPRSTRTCTRSSLPSATTGWAVGDGGAIYSWDARRRRPGSARPRRRATAATLRDVDFVPGGLRATIVGDDGTILATSNGTGWVARAAPDEPRTFAPSRCVAGGSARRRRERRARAHGRRLGCDGTDAPDDRAERDDLRGRHVRGGPADRERPRRDVHDPAGPARAAARRSATRTRALRVLRRGRRSSS